jgi:hypothetical protein
MREITFNVNGQSFMVETEPEKPLLWVLREDLGLTGAKYGCGMAVRARRDPYLFRRDLLKNERALKVLDPLHHRRCGPGTFLSQ